MAITIKLITKELKILSYGFTGDSVQSFRLDGVTGLVEKDELEAIPLWVAKEIYVPFSVLLTLEFIIPMHNNLAF